ncbi:MAG: nitric oxide reductase transcriptional regulator NorR [Polyangia bacterium]|jgi:anaerobic nitric oxide reductase transcription regulator
MDQLDAVVNISLDLSAGLSAADRNRRLLEALRRVIPYEAATLMRLEGGHLLPVVTVGLSPSASGKPYPLREHPRLEIICRSREPVLFPSDTNLPDPFDGQLKHDEGARHIIHACLGCPLLVHGELVGALTADALDPNAFDGIDLRFLTAVAALAAAEMRTTQLIAALEQAAEHQGLVARDLMRDAMMQGSEIIGTSAAILRLRREIDLVARSDFSVLIHGETGTGKELVARAVHAASTRRNEPIIHVNCAALPETLAEAELFGHVRGAFTGAASDRPGKFEVADGGTLFLDEIGELPLTVQPKLLRVLQEGEIQRVGADRTLKVNVRALAATNRDLAKEVAAGHFRADLFHRLNVYPLTVPPLRERGEDIALLAGYFCDTSRRRMGVGPVRLDASAIEALVGYPWPGNVRELENVVSRVVLRRTAVVPRGEAIVLSAHHLAADIGQIEFTRAESPTFSEQVRQTTLKESARAHQREVVQRVLAEKKHNLAAAARSLGMDRGNFHRLVKRLGLRKPDD